MSQNINTDISFYPLLSHNIYTLLRPLTQNLLESIKVTFLGSLAFKPNGAILWIPGQWFLSRCIVKRMY